MEAKRLQMRICRAALVAPPSGMAEPGAAGEPCHGGLVPVAGLTPDADVGSAYANRGAAYANRCAAYANRCAAHADTPAAIGHGNRGPAHADALAAIGYSYAGPANADGDSDRACPDTDDGDRPAGPVVGELARAPCATARALAPPHSALTIAAVGSWHLVVAAAVGGDRRAVLWWHGVVGDDHRPAAGL